jgi:hypothetical protein
MRVTKNALNISDNPIASYNTAFTLRIGRKGADIIKCGF